MQQNSAKLLGKIVDNIGSGLNSNIWSNFMISSVSPSSQYFYLSNFESAGPSAPAAPSYSKQNPWVGNSVSKNNANLEANLCCDGYSIESVIDQAYEAGLGDRPEVMRLEQNPCLSCSELESIADELAAIEFANKEPSTQGDDELRSMSKDMDRFIAEEQ